MAAATLGHSWANRGYIDMGECISKATCHPQLVDIWHWMSSACNATRERVSPFSFSFVNHSTLSEASTPGLQRYPCDNGGVYIDDLVHPY
jgi:hypothetical protein